MKRTAIVLLALLATAILPGCSSTSTTQGSGEADGGDSAGATSRSSSSAGASSLGGATSGSSISGGGVTSLGTSSVAGTSGALGIAGNLATAGMPQLGGATNGGAAGAAGGGLTSAGGQIAGGTSSTTSTVGATGGLAGVAGSPATVGGTGGASSTATGGVAAGGSSAVTCSTGWVEFNGVCKPTIRSLSLAKGTLSPVFDPTVAVYAANVDADRTSVSATSSVPGAVLSINGESGDQVDLILTQAVTEVAVTVTAENVSQTYTLAVTRLGGQQAYIKASNTNALDNFGNAIALSGDGNTLAVAAFVEDSAEKGVATGNDAANGVSNSGAVYVFVRNSSGNWSQQACLKASNTGVDDYFGNSLALSADGNTLAVGAPNEDSAESGIATGNDSANGASNSGAVYVFTRSSSTWRQQACLKASNTDASDSFGSSVALSTDGNTLAVGATGEDGSEIGVGHGTDTANLVSNSGAVYVFARNSGAWSQQAYLKAINSDTSDAFGAFLAMSGDGNTLAIGATLEDSAAQGIDADRADNTATSAGAVYVFVRVGITWSFQAYLKASNAEANDMFGQLSMAADGNTLAVSAFGEDSVATGIGGDQTDNSASYAGAVYVFGRTGTKWTQQAYLKGSNTEAGDRFGQSVGISGDGNTLAVGASNEDSAARGINGDQMDNSAASSGAVYVLARTGNAWKQKAYVKPSNTDPNDYFGTHSPALSTDGRTLVVGNNYEASAGIGINGDTQADNSTGSAGAAYVFVF